MDDLAKRLKAIDDNFINKFENGDDKKLLKII